MRFAERFWSKVAVGAPGECWPWQAGFRSEKSRYGSFSINGHDHYAHRVAFFLANGRWPEDCCLHSCDNTACCNPTHLFEGTYRDNNSDRDQKARRWNSKLSLDDVLAIRAQHSRGAGVTALAKEYGVSKAHVSLVLSGDRWIDTERRTTY